MTLRSTLVLAALSATTAAAQRVSFPSFTGPSATTVRNQIVGAVCDTADCVSAAKTTTSGKPDWKKAKKASVQFFVTGTVSKRGKALALNLFVFNKAGPPMARKSFPVERSGQLSKKSLQAVMHLLTGAFGAQKTLPTEPTKPPPEEEKPPEQEATLRPTQSPLTDEKSTPAPEPENRGEAQASPEPKDTKPHFLVVDLGVEVLNRQLEYHQVQTSNLRRYDLALFGQLALGVQFYPLALVRDDLLAGLGLEFGLALAPWLQSRLSSIEGAFPTSATRIDAGVRFSVWPIKSFALNLAPYVGIRMQNFTVGALADGRRIDGLPNIAFIGLRAGLAVDVPVVPGWVNLFGHFGIIPLFSSGEISSAAFFPNGSALGLEGGAGVGVRVVSFLQVRAAFDFARYALTFNTQPTDPYVAAGAADRYLGGKASVRLTF